MLNRFKLFNSRDKTAAGGVVNGAAVYDSSSSQKRQLPSYPPTQKNGGSQIPSYTAGTLPQSNESEPQGRYTGSPGRSQQHQRAPAPPLRHASPGLQEPGRARAAQSSHEHAGEAASKNSFGFNSNRYSQQQQPRAIQPRRSTDRGTREVFIDQPPGGVDDVAVVYDGSRSSSSSVPSRTASSTSISSIASSTTTGGGPRRSGLARRVSSSAQPDKRNGKSAATAAATSSNTRGKSAKPTSSSSSIPGPSTPGSVNRAAAKQAATPGDTSAGSARRQRGSTTTKDDSTSPVPTAEAEQGAGRACRGLIPRRSSSKAGQPVDQSEVVDVASPSSGRRLPQTVNSRRSLTPDRDAMNSSDRMSTADSSVNSTSASKSSRMPQPSVSAVPDPSASPQPTVPRLSLPTAISPDVDQRRHNDRQPSTPVSVTAPSSPAISGQALTHRSASVGRPTKDRSSSSISSGFGDESNSTSDSTDSVIFQPSSASTVSRVTSTTSTTTSKLCESSSSAIDSDSPPSDTTLNKIVDSSAVECSSTSMTQSPPSTHHAVDHITSLRGSHRQSLDDVKPVSSSPVDQAAAKPGGDTSTSESSPRATELIDVFDCIKPMQPLVRSSIPCCVYEPTTRRLPTLLAQSAGGSPSRRLVLSRPPIGSAGVGCRGAVAGRPGARESLSACGYMSDGDVVRGGGNGSSAGGRAADRLMSGYTSEGGGGAGVTSYARRMQQRFLEGILAVRQSMERTPQLTDDDRLVASVCLWLIKLHLSITF